MDDISFSNKANISSISRFDHQVKEIILSASQVALYAFSATKSTWIKRKIEGACFFYKRKTSPKYGICILNRLDTNNFVELLNSTMEIQLQEPYILYRNIFKTIYGIWFYEKSECTAIATVFQRCLDELKEKELLEREVDDGEAATSTQITDKACSAEISADTNSQENSLKSNSQPDSVRQFFAKASKEATKSQPMSTVQRTSSNKSICGAFKSVAHIEKAQKSDNQESLSTSDICSSNYHPNDIVSPIRSSSANDEPLMNGLENHMKSFNLCPSVHEVEKFSHNLLLNREEIASTSEFPELISPGMLLTPDTIKADAERNQTRSNGAKILSKNQMLEAFQYLLKNDSTFIDSLYDSYLKSARKN